MNKICLTFLVNQSMPLRLYRFFEIGDHAPYLDEYALAQNTRSLAKHCYLPVNQLILRHIKNSNKQLRVAIYLSGLTAGILENYAPEAYDSFRQLAETGCVEFLSGTYSWSLASLFHPAAFLRQIADHRQCMEKLTGQKASGVFINTGLFYDQRLGAVLSEEGMNGVITSGDKKLLGWKSPDALYADAHFPGLKIFFHAPEHHAAFLKQFRESKDPINLMTFSPEPEEGLPGKEESRLINLILPYQLLVHQEGYAPGNLQQLDHFLYASSHSTDLECCSPSDVLPGKSRIPSISSDRMMPVEGGNNFLIYEPENDLQREALTRLFEMTGKMETTNDPAVWHEWNILQSSCHVESMSGRYFNPEPLPEYNPSSTPGESFINFMNVLNDFNLKLDQLIK